MGEESTTFPPSRLLFLSHNLSTLSESRDHVACRVRIAGRRKKSETDAAPSANGPSVTVVGNGLFPPLFTPVIFCSFYLIFFSDRSSSNVLLRSSLSNSFCNGSLPTGRQPWSTEEESFASDAEMLTSGKLQRTFGGALA